VQITLLLRAALALVLLGSCHGAPRVPVAFSSPEDLPPRYFEWYSAHLAAMGMEFPLSLQDEGYRLLWLRSFHHPIAISASCASQNCSIEMVELDGASGRQPGRVIRRNRTSLSETDWRHLIHELSQVGFWTRSPSQRTGLDGSRWVLEGVRNGEYRLWSVWSPGFEGRFPHYLSLGSFLIRASGVSVPDDEFY
jgi:hypothetical protein